MTNLPLVLAGETIVRESVVKSPTYRQLLRGHPSLIAAIYRVRVNVETALTRRNDDHSGDSTKVRVSDETGIRLKRVADDTGEGCRVAIIGAIDRYVNPDHD
jgi:hypothetical protein